MAITLKTLITAAPFDEATRTGLLAKLDVLTDDQKLRLSTACWQSLAQQFQARYKAKVATALLEMREGTKKYSKEDLQKIETDMYDEFAKLLQSAQTQEGISEVKQELQKFLPQEPANNPPPPASPEQPQVMPSQGTVKKEG